MYVSSINIKEKKEAGNIFAVYITKTLYSEYANDDNKWKLPDKNFDKAYGVITGDIQMACPH